MSESRRLPGPNLYSARAGAVLEVERDPSQGDRAVSTWEGVVRALLDRLGWEREEVIVRRWPWGAGLFITAPLDGLLAATDVNEYAWAIAMRPPGGGPGSSVDRRTSDAAFEDSVARLKVHVQHERNPRLVALASEAAARQLVISFDDEAFAVGSGTGVHTWSLQRIPDARNVDWDAIHDVPIALVTGSNGKTTTTRLLASILRASGLVAGYCCTTGVHVGDDLVAEGDYSGPAGARLVLHDARVQAAVLETARGGILRRGLAPSLADVAIVTRVAADHLGEYGVTDIAALGQAKLVVAKALRPGRHLVLNADDETLVSLASRAAFPVVWFSLDAANPVIRAHVETGGSAVVLHEGMIVALHDDAETRLLAATDAPITLEGHARHNIANALAATAAAMALQVPMAIICAVLRAFGRSANDNPGRLHQLAHNGATVIVDFVHNPDGWRALYEATRHLRTGRLLVLFGQAGDRDDEAMTELARAVWEEHPDLIVLKELPDYLRGREPGATPDLLAHALEACGAPATAIRYHPDEVQAAREALAEARPGDLVILAVHSNYGEVMELVGDAR